MIKPNYVQFTLSRLFFSIILMDISLFIGYKILGFIPPSMTLFVALIIPLGLTSRWRRISRDEGWSWFLWCKTYTVLLACYVILLSAVEGISSELAAISIVILLIANIIEACIKDFQNGNNINGISGLIIAIMAPSWDSVTAGTQLLYGVSPYWIAAFSLWNIIFVYKSHGFATGHHIAILSASIMIGVVEGWGSWLQARALMLGSFLVIYNSYYGWFKYRFRSDWANNLVFSIIEKIGLGCVLILLFMDANCPV